MATEGTLCAKSRPGSALSPWSRAAWKPSLPQFPKWVSSPEFCEGSPSPSRAGGQEGRHRAGSPDRPFVAHLFSARPPVADLTLSHLLRTPPPPWTLNLVSSQVTPTLSDVQACHQTLRAYQEASCSSRSYYCAIWQVAGPGTGGGGPAPKGISSAQVNCPFYTSAPRVGEGKKPEDSGSKWPYQSPFHPAPLTLGKG